ncbi:MMPL family transporter [Fervidobacterium sp.]|uniref:efflux RND transporter permease subunit n=1 Tax=Fervidobacterium sp. TaxID=1871331 RepID=UPI0025C4927D|nr:MMPL family transporter [Fervidobacterium sp.]
MLLTFLDCIAKYKFTIISLMLLVLSVIIILNNAKVETRIETFLPGYKPGRPITEIDDPSVQNLVRMSLKFGDSARVSVIYESPVRLDKTGSLENLRRLHKKLENFENVQTVISILNYPGADLYIKDDALDLENLPKEYRSFISMDGRYALFLVMISINGQVEPVVRKITNALKNEPVVVLSEASVNNKLFDELKRSMFFYPILMFGVILAIFFYQTQSLRATIVSLFVPIMASIYTYALHFAFGGVLNILTSMIASFLIIIGSAYPLHYYNAIFRTEDNVRKHISTPIFFSMFTTAVGFLSFLFVKIPAFKEFGFLVSLGLLIDFLLTVTVGDELLLRAHRKAAKKPKSFGIKYIGNKPAMGILFVVIFLVGLSFFLIPSIKVGLTSTDYFSKKSEITKAYKLLEDNFGMKDAIYLVLEREEGIFLPFDNRNIDQIIAELSQRSEISSVDFPRNVPVTALILASRNQPLLRYYIADAKTIRILINLSPEGADNLEKVTKITNEVMKKYSYNYYLAGTPFIWKAVNDDILASQIQSLVAALIIVFVTILVVFKDFAESVKLISPVVFATILNFFYMAIFKMKLEISTALTSSIIIGLAIDYSIHVGHDYGKTKNIFSSIKNVGPAILGNAFGIVGGFLTLLIGGELAMFKRIAILVSLGISTAAVLTLTVLPFLLSLGRIKEVKESLNDEK